MRIGTVKEIKTLEFRVGLTPEGVRELAAQGHSVVVESGAGAGIGLADSTYEEAGGRVVANAAAVFENSDLIVKVKEPQAGEIAMLRPNTPCSPICIWPRPRADAD